MKYIVVLIISVVVLGVLIASNPNTQDHRKAIKAKIIKIVEKEFSMTNIESNEGNTLLGKYGSLIGTSAVSNFVDDLVRENVNCKNYLLFSLTSIEYNGETNVIGVGILGSVFVGSGFDNNVYQLKNKFSKFAEDFGINNSSNNSSNNNSTTNRRPAGTRDYIVNASSNHQVHFYNTPDYSSMRKSYFDSREVVTPLQIVNGFGYLIFTNRQNQTSKGWIPMEELELVGNY
jgi:hypothetical protein